MNHSESIGKIAEALAKAQKNFSPAVKDSANPFFKSNYLSLAGAIDACRDALSANGLAIVQTMDDGERLRLTTTLMHSSGEWITSHYPVNPVKNDPQGIGSAITYARRYSLMAIVGLAAEDDDGESASGRQAPPKKADSQGNPAAKKPAWTAEQQKEAGAIRADILAEFGDLGDKQLAIVRQRVAYDQPSEAIDAIATLLNELRETKNQGNK